MRFKPFHPRKGFIKFMTIPTFQKCLYPFLISIKDKKDHHMNDIRQNIYNYFNLSDQEKNQILPSGSSSVIDDRVG